MVLEISGWRRHRQRWRSGLTRKQIKDRAPASPGPFLFVRRRSVRRRAKPARALVASRFGANVTSRQALLPDRKNFGPPPISAACRANPRKGWRCARGASIWGDETNQIIDELSLQPVIYRLASPRRRGTIGGGSTTGAPQQIVSGCKWRISVVHCIWTRKNPDCAQKKCPVDGFRC